MAMIFLAVCIEKNLGGNEVDAVVLRKRLAFGGDHIVENHRYFSAIFFSYGIHDYLHFSA